MIKWWGSNRGWQWAKKRKEDRRGERGKESRKISANK